MTRLALALVLTTLLSDPGAQGTPGSSSLPPPAAAASSLAWMAGHWTGTDGPLQMEEFWTGTAGGALIGLHKDVAPKAGVPRLVSFEFLRIEPAGDGLVYIAQPGGRPATRFPLAETGARRAVFANPAHDFPQRILYWLDDAGALHARIEGPRGGRTVAQEWTWTRVKS